MVVGSFQMDVIREPSVGRQVDAVLCIWISVAKVDRYTFAAAVNNDNAFLLEPGRLAGGSFAAVTAVSNGAGGRDDAVPGYARILEELERRSDQPGVGWVASELGYVAIGGHAAVGNGARDVVHFGCTVEEMKVSDEVVGGP